MNKISDIRAKFGAMLEQQDFVIDKSGVPCLELIGESFLVTDDHIFSPPNLEWNKRELNWYDLQSLNVNDIEQPIPEIWKQVADKDGFINSNYGWCVYSKDNGYQYHKVFNELYSNPDSRRAEMIYTRPSIHDEYNLNGRSDFICTDSVSYFIRNGRLVAHVKMRSNDSIHGFRGDVFWQKTVQGRLANELKVPVGDMIWTASSQHIYQRHFAFVEHYLKTGEHNKTMKQILDKNEIGE